MIQLLLKAMLTGVLVIVASEIAKRSSLFSAILISLPVTSILAITWVYLDTNNVETATTLSKSIFWMVLPSLFFFIAFPFFVKVGLQFYSALAASSASMVAVYWGYVFVIKKIGINL